MEVKNGIIIDGVLHELKESNKDCKKCSLYNLCMEEFDMKCLCWIGLDSESIEFPAVFFNRGKVNIVKEE